MTMQSIDLNESLFKGAVSIQATEGWVKPWRVPYRDAELFQPGHINGKAEIPAGVRLSFHTDSSRVQVRVVPEAYEIAMDCVVNGVLVHTALMEAGSEWASFESLPSGTKLVEIYLSQKQPVRIREVNIDSGATCSASSEEKFRWVAYGSSITQCAEAASPSQTWPALAAAELGLDLTCLGYGGNCHMEPMVARMIRDLPADFISVCVGINIMGGSSYSERTFRPALIGFLQIIREKHPDTPIAVISPIYSPDRETNENKVGLNLQKMREQIEDVVTLLKRRGDDKLYYLHGLHLFGETYGSYLPDRLHPNAEGYRIMATRFAEWAGSTVPLLNHNRHSR
ncbi:SGNH/GDSL hydrolase family protein [Paenibacillus allorhizosphaerae]|nr:SGNH/GDSL hydrolase family protein [Paenibacillus allorhizosphaerae]